MRFSNKERKIRKLRTELDCCCVLQRLNEIIFLLIDRSGISDNLFHAFSTKSANSFMLQQPTKVALKHGSIRNKEKHRQRWCGRFCKYSSCCYDFDFIVPWKGFMQYNITRSKREKFNAPVIGFSTFHSTRWANDLMGNPSPLSYISHPMLDFPDRMSFLDRMHNTLFYIYESMVLTFLHHPLQRSVYNFAFPDAQITYEDARKNVALTFINTHFTLGSPLPYVPNIIEVGGIHVNRKKSPLPQDIEELINSAKHGVVYFSFGSIIKGDQLSIEKRNAFINTFAIMKQKFIWKFEDATVKMPSNVLVRSWLPQTDILGHPNVVAFISHGGLLGLTEAVYHGVAVLGIPLFGDQRLNIKRATQSGWAVTLDYNNISASSVEWAVNEILQEKYLENAKTVSKRYRDQPMTPIETMVYWCEYVIRHKGAPHLRSPGLDLNYIQYHNLDVFATIAAVGVFLVYLVKEIWKKICGGNSKVRVEKGNSKKKQ